MILYLCCTKPDLPRLNRVGHYFILVNKSSVMRKDSDPARPLGELCDRLGRQPLRGAKNASEKEKGTEKMKNHLSHTPRS